MKAQVIPFPISLKFRKHNVIPHEWMKIKKDSQGRRLNSKELQTLWVILRLATEEQTLELETDYPTLIDECNFDRSQPQFKRYLKSLVKAGAFTYSLLKTSIPNKLIISINPEFLNSLGLLKKEVRI